MKNNLNFGFPKLNKLFPVLVGLISTFSLRVFSRSFALVILGCILPWDSFMGKELFAQAAWNPYERQLFVRPTAMASRYDSAFLSDRRAQYDEAVHVNTGMVTLEYGITDNLAVDGTVGFGRLSGHQLLNRPYIQSPREERKHGTTDGRFGIRYKITDEFMSDYKWMPTITVRIGGIHKGDYDRNPQALGDGASGWEGNLYWAKDFNFWGLGTYGEVGYRVREKPVPEDVLYGWGIYKRLFQDFLLIFGGRGQKGQEGYAFFDPRGEPGVNFISFDTSRFQSQGINWYDYYISNERPPWGRREDFHTLEAGIGYTDSSGNFYYLWASEVVSGFNTARLRTVGFMINFPFYL